MNIYHLSFHCYAVRKRLDTILLGHCIRNYPNLPHSLLIYFLAIWRVDKKISGFAAQFAGCVWTEAADLEISGCPWMKKRK